MSWADRYRFWNTTPDEQAAIHPADVHAAPRAQHMVRAIDVDAPAERVFRWLCQLKVAPYSYDLIDNLGRRSPQQLTPGTDELDIGQRFAVFARIVDFVDGDYIVATSGDAPVFGRVAMSYQVVTGRAAQSRIIACIAVGASSAVGRLARDLLVAGDLVMMRRQLVNLKELAEQGRTPRLRLLRPHDHTS